MSFFAFTLLLILTTLTPVGLSAWVRSRRNMRLPRNYWSAIIGFAAFNIGLFTLFWALWAMAGGGHMSMRSYLNGSVLLLIASVIIACAMHLLSLPKKLATGFFIVPMLGYLVSMAFPHSSINTAVISIAWFSVLLLFPLLIAGYWVWHDSADV